MLVSLHKFCPEQRSSEFRIPHFVVLSTVPATALWKEGRGSSAPTGGGRASLCSAQAQEEPATLIKCAWKAPPHFKMPIDVASSVAYRLCACCRGAWES